ncbi:MAG: hypothetical protein OXG23_16880 [Chloroflexi bacterium]|nr:hypothetical protein [Chloroflexota bacterium]
MDPSLVKPLTLIALVAIVLRLGLVVHRRSGADKPIHGGALSQVMNFLSGLCFVAILPTVCLSVLILHPEALRFAGITWHPILFIVVALGLGSFVFALLHAIIERAPLQRAQQKTAAAEASGWTEADAKTSGL